jgi:hypothetical protein
MANQPGPWSTRRREIGDEAVDRGSETGRSVVNQPGDIRNKGKFDLSNLFSRMVVTLSLEGATARVVGCRAGQVQFWMGLPFDHSLLSNGFLSSPLRMGQMIGTAFRNRGIPTQNVVVAISGYGAQFKEFTVPKVAGNVDTVVPREARRQMGISLDDMHLTWQSLGARGGQERLFAVAIPRLPLELMAEALQAADIPPVEMDLKPLALARLAGSQEVIITNIETNSVDVVFVKEGLPLVVHSEFLPDEGEDIIRSRLLRLAAQTAEEASVIASRSNSRKLWATGDLATDGGLCTDLEYATGCQVSPIATSLRYPPDFPIGRFAVNLGLAMRKR